MYIGHSALRMYVMGKRALERDGDRRRHGAHGRRREGGAEGRRHGLLELARLDARHARRHAGRQPHRRMGGDRPHRRRRWPSSTPASSRSGRTSRAARAIAPSSTGCARWRSTTSGRSCSACWRPSRATIPRRWRYQTKYIDDTVAAGGRMFGQGTTRSINAIFSLKSYLPFDVLPAWKPIRAPAAGRAEEAAARPGGAPRAGRGRGAHEAARQRLPGRRRGDHGSAQARLRQPVRDEGRRLGRSRRSTSSPRRAASIRSRS